MSLQVINTFGYDIPRVVVDTLFAPPDDTFSVPVELQTIPFFAIKSGDLWRWNTVTFIWEIVSAGSSNTIYSGDGSLAGNRVVNLSGKTLNFIEGANYFLKLDPTLNAEIAELNAFNVSGNTSIIKASTTDIGSFADLIADFNSTTQRAEINLSAVSGDSAIGYNAQRHVFSQLSTVQFLHMSSFGVGFVGVDNSGFITFQPTPTSGGYTVVPIVASPYNAAQTSGEHILLIDTTAASGPVTINLPTAVGNTAKFTIKKIDAGADFVTIDGFLSETINDQLTQDIELQYTSATIVSNNLNWEII